MNAILPILIQVLPAALQGVESAVRIIDAAAGIFNKMEAEGRSEPTVEEVAAIRELRRQHYDDFFADDERKGG